MIIQLIDDISFESRSLLAVTKHGCQHDLGFITGVQNLQLAFNYHGL
jgi:hypothetical protein